MASSSIAVPVMLTLVMASSVALGAEATLDAVLGKAATWSARFDAMMKRSSFKADGHIESVSRSGETGDRRAGIFWMHRLGSPDARVEVVRYTEDGEDKTADAKEDVAKQEAKRRKKPKDPDKEVRLPFLASEQPKYQFRVIQHGPGGAGRIQIHFAPKEATKHRIVGSAWLDSKTGAVLTLGASPSKLSTFVDYLHVTMEFGETTSAGPAVSKIEFEGQGSFLFLRKKFRGAAVLSDYREPREPPSG